MNRFTAMLPERRLALVLLRRGAASWALVRLVVAVAPLLMGHAELRLDPSAAVGVILLTGLVGLVRASLRNEPRFLANLGIAPLATALISVAPAVLGEGVLGFLLPR